MLDTGIPVSVWLAEDPETLATVLARYEAKAKESKKRKRRR